MSSSLPKIAILLCTFNGEAFLREQLESIGRQTHTEWELWASDDGSDDGTETVLLEYTTKWGTEKLHHLKGPKRGWCANFFSLIGRSNIKAPFFAFCDQDDIWLPDKLSRALAWLETQPDNLPAMYCSRTDLIDETGNHIGQSPLFLRPPGFANALVQNIGGGNTMVFNQCARALLASTINGAPVVTHDWWLYILVCAVGGQTYYDAEPGVLYRQHGTNQVGSNMGWWARWRRLNMLFQGEHRRWTELHVNALKSIIPQMTEHNYGTYGAFCSSRRQHFVHRLLGLWRSGVYRQTKVGRLAFWLGAFLGKI